MNPYLGQRIILPLGPPPSEGEQGAALVVSGQPAFAPPPELALPDMTIPVFDVRPVAPNPAGPGGNAYEILTAETDQPYNPYISDFPKTFTEGQEEHQEVDALRWGDADATPQVAIVGAPFRGVSKQLARCNTNNGRPITWLVQLFAGGSQVPAGEVAAINVTFSFSVGVGQSRITMTPAIVLTAANEYQVAAGTVPPQFFIPALDLQINAVVTYLPTVGGPVVIETAAMCAPFAQITPMRVPSRRGGLVGLAK
jgi:hypothetical protein